jgi:hypothetical protein
MLAFLSAFGPNGCFFFFQARIHKTSASKYLINVYSKIAKFSMFWGGGFHHILKQFFVLGHCFTNFKN